MIPIYDETQVARDPKTWHWLQNLHPDQTVPLLSTTDDCYRPDDDYCDDDGTDSMLGSDTPSAGDSTAGDYTRTLEKNRIINAKINLETFELDVTFTDEVGLSSKQEAYVWSHPYQG
jgi:hypothetical protein